MRRTHLVACLVRGVVLAALVPAGAVLAQSRIPDYAQISIEDLMNIEITSASRREQRAGDAAAAVYVLTHEEIRHSGMTAIPDLLRLVPGVDVARINANKWAVSVRGFNGLYANKLLVLVDGRTVYNRLFSGVLWDAEDLVVDDIDRIEVIRGPGAALWGANAVNGVINIVTKTTAETLGALVRVEAGRSGEQATARYGATAGSGSYRVYSQATGGNESVIVPGIRADDRSKSIVAGVRADWNTAPGAFMLEGDVTAGQARALWPNLDPQTAARTPLAADPSDSSGGHLLGRWSHTRHDDAVLQVQAFVDVARRQEPVGDYTRRTVDLEAQYHTRVGGRQEIVGGAGYRFINEQFLAGVGSSLNPAEDRSSLVTAFVQDEVALFDHRLALTFGSQLQYDSDAGVGAQPSVRAMWKASPRQRLWAATSRALRTPSLEDRGIRLDYPPVPTGSGLPLVVTLLGNADAETETFVDAEAGYRLDFKTASIDVTGYVGRYGHLRTDELAPPVVQFVPSPQILAVTRFGNNLEATTRGIEVVGRWAPAAAWHLDGSYTAFRMTPHLAAASLDPRAAGEEGSAPRSQWQLRSGWSIAPRTTLSLALFHVGPIEQIAVAAYTRADVNAEWRITPRISAMVVGQNLLDAAHPEFGSGTSLLLATQIPRSIGFRLRWELR